MTETVKDQRNSVAVSGFTNPLTLETNVEDADHIKVYADDQLLARGTDYTVAGAGDTGDLDEIDGIEITILDTGDWADFDYYTVEHDPPLDQDYSFGAGFGAAYMAALDAIARRMQAVGSFLSRSLQLPVSAVGVDVTLPHPDPGKALKWNEAGDALENTLADPDTEGLVEAAAFADLAEAAATAAELAETNAEAAAAAALADRILAQAAAAEAGDLTALLAFLVPVGTSIMHNAATAPTYYLKENGAAVSRTTYAALFAVIGTQEGAGDGSTTFNLPESRGEFFRGLDDGRGVDSGRAIGSAQAEMIGPHSHTAVIDNGGAHAHSYGIYLECRRGANGASNSPAWSSGDVGTGAAGLYTSTDSGGSHTHTITIANNSGTENRPRNKAKLMCIKY